MSPILKTISAGTLLVLFSGFLQASIVVNGGFENTQPQGSGNNPKGVNLGADAAYPNSVSVASLNEWTGYTAPVTNDDVPPHYI